MKKTILRLAVLSAPLLSLTACGEGWEAQKTDTAFPYGNQRTAGSGVAYVRAKMLPEKELKIETAIEDIVEVPKPTLDAEEIFTEQQIKGSPPAPANPEKPIEEEHSSLDPDDLNYLDTDLAITKPSAEEYIAQEPKKIEEIEEAQIDISEIEPLSGTATDLDMGEIEDEFNMVFEEDDTIQIYENEVYQPIKQIIVPKKDFFDLRSDGEISLEKIYEDAFMSSF